MDYRIDPAIQSEADVQGLLDALAGWHVPYACHCEWLPGVGVSRPILAPLAPSPHATSQHRMRAHDRRVLLRTYAKMRREDEAWCYRIGPGNG